MVDRVIPGGILATDLVRVRPLLEKFLIRHGKFLQGILYVVTEIPVVRVRCFQIKAVPSPPTHSFKTPHVLLTPTMSDFGSYGGGSMVRASGLVFCCEPERIRSCQVVLIQAH